MRKLVVKTKINKDEEEPIVGSNEYIEQLYHRYAKEAVDFFKTRFRIYYKEHDNFAGDERFFYSQQEFDLFLQYLDEAFEEYADNENTIKNLERIKITVQKDENGNLEYYRAYRESLSAQKKPSKKTKVPKKKTKKAKQEKKTK